MIRLSYTQKFMECGCWHVTEQYGYKRSSTTQLSGCLSLLPTMPDPVVLLPFELIDSIVFDLFARDEKGFVKMSYMQPPLSYLRVSKSWNAFMIKNPAYWCSIFADGARRRVSESQVAGIEQWLARSGNKPLSIRVTGCPSQWRDDLYSYQLERLLSPFLKRKSRWQHVDFGFDETAKHLAGVISNAPILRTFSLIYYPAIAHGLRCPENRVFKADLTNCFTLERLIVPVGSDVTVHPYNNIRHLEINYNKSQAQLILLLSCDRIQSLEITVWETKERWTCDESMTYPDLRDLHINIGTSDPSNVLKQFARIVKAPGLRSLKFDQFKGGRRFDQWEFADMAKNLMSFVSNLEELELSVQCDRLMTRTEEIVKILTTAPRIKKLLLSYGCFSEEVCSALQYHACPDLVELTLSPGNGRCRHPAAERICTVIKQRAYAEGSELGTLKTLRCQGSENLAFMQKELRDYALSIHHYKTGPYDND